MALAPRLRLVGRAVEFDHGAVDGDLVFGVHAGQRVEDLAVDGGHGLGHALAEVARLVAIAQFHRLMCARRGAGGHRGPAHGAVFQHDIHFDGRVAAAIEDFAGGDVDDGGHFVLLKGSGSSALCGRGALFASGSPVPGDQALAILSKASSLIKSRL